jgi:hypothetical protein
MNADTRKLLENYKKLLEEIVEDFLSLELNKKSSMSKAQKEKKKYIQNEIAEINKALQNSP